MWNITLRLGWKSISPWTFFKYYGFCPFKNRSIKLRGCQKNASYWHSPYCKTVLVMDIVKALLVIMLLGIVIEKDNTAGIIRHVAAKKGIRRKLKSLLLVVNSSFMIMPLLVIVFFQLVTSEMKPQSYRNILDLHNLTDKLWQ